MQRTVGSAEKVVLKLDRPADATLRQHAPDHASPNILSFSVQNAAGELPAILEAVNATGAKVVGLSIKEPTLQAVFIHLTGNALRE